MQLKHPITYFTDYQTYAYQKCFSVSEVVYGYDNIWCCLTNQFDNSLWEDIFVKGSVFQYCIYAFTLSDFWSIHCVDNDDIEVRYI